ncbi:MAG: peptide chain release factor 2 [Clostridia bacterium]|nr:peptide chain release factor 2 [Clostridia bacterium]
MKNFDELNIYFDRFNPIEKVIDIGAFEAKVADLNKTLETVDYSDAEAVKKIGSESRQIGEVLENFKFVKNFIELAKTAQNSQDLDLLAMLGEDEEKLKEKLNSLEVYLLFNGKFDDNDCLVEVHSGAGGVDAQDWASIVAEMYVKFAQSHGFGVSILDVSPGEEAGIKSETIKISGSKAYGKLQYETGVHRLVRISPFDANARRHTSFASVLVTPIIEETGEIEIRPEDLKIDTFRSNGAGGQNVNKTESAVRITHLPTGTVVACQNERSQIQNKEQAMKMLISKLAQIKQAEIDSSKDSARKEQKKIEWGSQIRSYVFAPYTLVKDLRTGCETSNVSKVLAGEIDEFINSELRYYSSKN